jgi:O-antigen/teichoic acid export membrane protein
VGVLSALLAFRTMASTLIENLSNVLTPAVSTLEARGASGRVGALLVASTRYAAVSAALICIVPLAVATSFLTLWLGEQARPFAPVMYTILIGQIPAVVSASAQQVVVGLGRARFAGSIVATRGAASLAAALLYLGLASEPTLLGATLALYAVQAAGGAAMLLFGARASGVGVLAFVRDGLLRPLALALLGAVCTALVASWLGSSSWWSLATCLGVGEALFAALVVFLGVDAAERRRIWDFALRAWSWART